MKYVTHFLTFVFTIFMTLLLVACLGDSSETPQTGALAPPTDSFEWDDGVVAAIACLGYLNSNSLGVEFENWSSVYDAYADTYSIFADVPISEVKTLVLSGDEVYCLIPRYENTRIIVETLELNLENDNDNLMEVIDVVFDDSAKSLVINCNVSDLFSNVQITIITDDKEISFSPSISLKDGSVVAGDKIQVLYLEGVYSPDLETD